MKTLSYLSVFALCASVLAVTPSAHARSPNDASLTQQATVLSTLSAPPYIYIEAAQGTKTLWLAATSVAVKKGDVIHFDQDMVMSNFYSKSLKRTFPSVVFVNRLTVAGKK